MKPDLRTLRAVCVVALAAAGCFDPSYDNGSLHCSADGQCPDGYVCAADERCYQPNALPDLAVSLDCPGTQHRCGDSCVSNLDVMSCGVSCSPCAAVTHATTSCDGTSCQYACDTGYKPCNGACVSNSDDTDCNGTCNPGFHLCGALCLTDSDVNHCGKRCAPCEPTAGSSNAPLCVAASDGGVVDDGGLEDYVCVTPNCAADVDCDAASYCDNNGVCQPRRAQGDACNTTADCKVGGCRECAAATAGCIDGFCCNAACGGACDACSVAGGASVNGTCAVIGAGGAGSPSCTPYLCNGTLASCPPSCAGDADCIATSYCDAGGTCQPRKAQGDPCNTSADCKVNGCRECGMSTAGCVDGFCCDAACGGACDACSVAAGGATNGTCGVIGAGGAGSPSCTPYVCNGMLASCPMSCAADSGCAAADYCDNNGTCQPQKNTNDPCDTTADCKVAGCRECTIACAAGFCI